LKEKNSTCLFLFFDIFGCQKVSQTFKEKKVLQGVSKFKKNGCSKVPKGARLQLLKKTKMGFSKVPQGASNFLERGAQRCSLKLKRCSNEAPGAQKSPKVPQGALKKVLN
jgi:hypothetical protein